MADLYESTCRESIEDREGFWTRAAGLIDWFVPALKAWDDHALLREAHDGRDDTSVVFDLDASQSEVA